MSDHKRIYLEPGPPGADRQWCEDQIEDDWVEYVRADFLADSQRELGFAKQNLDIGDAEDAWARSDFEKMKARAVAAEERVRALEGALEKIAGPFEERPSVVRKIARAALTDEGGKG